MTQAPALGLSPSFGFAPALWGATPLVGPAPADPAQALVQRLLFGPDAFSGGGAASVPAPFASSLSADPGLSAETDVIRQQLGVLGLDGQRMAGGAPGFDPQQMQEMLTLMVGLIMLGGLAQQNNWNTGGFPGGQGNRNLAGIPGSGRDLGSFGAPSPVLSPFAGQTPPGGGIDAAQLQQIVPGLSSARANELMPHLNAAMAEAGIHSPRQQAAFIAQLAHESGGFNHFEEIASGAAYEGRSDLGNTQPGDGRRFKGRGPIQLTGRANYRAAGQALGLDLEANPELAARPDVGFRVAAWFWNSRGLNEFAEAGNFREVTRRINGGFNGLADRERYYQRALQFV